jgi:hypothetical protein
MEKFNRRIILSIILISIQYVSFSQQFSIKAIEKIIDIHCNGTLHKSDSAIVLPLSDLLQDANSYKNYFKILNKNLLHLQLDTLFLKFKIIKNRKMYLNNTLCKKCDLSNKKAILGKLGAYYSLLVPIFSIDGLYALLGQRNIDVKNKTESFSLYIYKKELENWIFIKYIPITY